MPKKVKQRKSSSGRDDDEYVKAAAWAWYQHGAGAPSKFVSESDAQNRQNPASSTTRSSRFKLEAARLVNLNSPSPSFHRVSKRPKPLDGLDKSIVGRYLGFHEDEDVGISSLLDHYEILELSRRLETSLSISVEKSAVRSEKSWIELGLSADFVHTPSPTVDVGHNNYKKKVSKASKSAVIKKWLTPAMCRMTDVVIPGMAEIGSPKRSPSVQHHRSSFRKNGHSNENEKSHGVRQRLRQALVLSLWKRPSHENNNIWTSSARRNSWDSS